jgi:hypothetical protein
MGDQCLRRLLVTGMTSLVRRNKHHPGLGYQMGPGAFDIAALQKLYGANTSYHPGGDIYGLLCVLRLR